MRSIIGIIGGFCLTCVLILTGEWAYTMIASPDLQTAHTAFTFLVALVSLAYIAISVMVGGYLSALIDDSQQATAGYSVLQLFFGVWFFREFWTTGFLWYKPVALFLIIPCAMLGRHWARRTRSTTGFQPITSNHTT